MNAQELWQRYQDWLYFNEDLGLYLDVSRMRFDERLALNQSYFDGCNKDLRGFKNLAGLAA